MTENKEDNGKMESRPEPESPVQCNERENDSGLPNLDPSPLNNRGDKNKPNSFIRGIRESLRRSESMKEKPTEGSAFVRFSNSRFSLGREKDKLTEESIFIRSSKRLPWRRPKTIDTGNHAGKPDSSISEENDEFGKDQDGAKKEPLSGKKQKVFFLDAFAGQFRLPVAGQENS